MGLRKIFCGLTPPSLGDNTASIDRLAKQIKRKTGEWPLVSLGDTGAFAALIRHADHKVTATLASGPSGPVIVALEAGDTSGVNPAPGLARRAGMLPASLWGEEGLGVALDLGSTHLAAALVDLPTGEELARGNILNPQTGIAADILGRIQKAADPEVHKELCGSLRRRAGGLIARLCSKAGREAGLITGLCAAGNTTMTHFFLGLDVQSICREPYIPVVNRPAPFFARELGFELAPGAVAWCLPNVGSYFGGDLVGGIVAAGLHERQDPAILVDVGTNAEVVVGNRDWLLACAGAAGPALEGGVARMGVLAQPGAIEGVSIDPATFEPSLKIIPDAEGSRPRPLGLCGSGVLQLLAQMYLTRVMDMRGRIVLTGHPRVVETDEGLGYVVASAQEAQGEPVVINEVEIDILLRSKAAMYTILRTVLLQVGMEFEDLSAFYVAGAFGNVIDPPTAITLGMLPDLPPERFIGLGNSSLAGCKELLLNPGARDQVETVTDRLTYLELNVNQELMNRFSAARFIPHTDHTRFPSVPVFHT